jgi:UDP-3-O-[3-hydroxymyristoyl] glucosamine N-acyltransferase
MNSSITVVQLAEIVGGTVRGDGNVKITGVSDVVEATPEMATWITSKKFVDALTKSRAGAVLVPADFGPTPMPAILCERVDRSVAKLLGAFAPPIPQPAPGIHPSAVVDETAQIGEGAAIGPCAVLSAGVTIGPSTQIHAGVYVGDSTSVGRDCVFWPNVVIREGCIIEDRVTIHSNAVIGADGLGYYFDEGRHNKVPHIGGVHLESDVEIGACSCVDRAKFGHTVVGRGTKIDNLVQLAHNVRIGEHGVLAAQCGISGSVRIGDYCVLGGRAGAVDNVFIGDRARLAGGIAIATKDVPPGSTVSGFPAQDHAQELREHASLRRLPALIAQVKKLAARIEQLELSKNDQSGCGV